jgi:hypothetical protein
MYAVILPSSTCIVSMIAINTTQSAAHIACWAMAKDSNLLATSLGIDSSESQDGWWELGPTRARDHSRWAGDAALTRHGQPWRRLSRGYAGGALLHLAQRGDPGLRRSGTSARSAHPPASNQSCRQDTDTVTLQCSHNAATGRYPGDRLDVQFV